jgi:hypothetical protein
MKAQTASDLRFHHSAGFPKMQVGRKLYVQPAEFDKWLKANQGKEVAI